MGNITNSNEKIDFLSHLRPKDAWDRLSLSDKAAMMKVAVRNGITNLKDIRQKYNEFAEGGNTVGELIDAIYQNNPKEEFLGEPSHHYDFTQSEEWANAHGYYPDARGHRDDRVKKPTHPSHLSRGTWNGDKFELTDFGMQNPNYTLFGLNDGGQDPQAILTYKGGVVLPELTVTPNGNYIENPYDNFRLHYSKGGNLYGDGGFTSELDWSPESWFSKRVAKPDGTIYNSEEAARLASHVPEYHNIEQTSKANGTWLKMPDGSTWEGDPRSWVMLQSQAYKKNYSPKPWYTGQAEWPTQFDYGQGKVDSNKVTRAPYYNNQMWFSDNKDYGQTFADYQNSKGLGWRFDTPGEEDVKGYNFLSAIPKEGNYRILESSSNGKPDQWQRLPFMLEDGSIKRLPEDQIIVDSKDRNIRADKQKVLTDDVVNWSKDLGDQGIFMQNIDDGAVIKEGKIYRQPVNEFISQPGFTNKVKFIEGNTGDFDIDNPYKYSYNTEKENSYTDNNFAAFGGKLSVAANQYGEGGSTSDDDLVNFLIKEEGFIPHPKDIGDGKITLGSGLTAKKWRDLYKKRGNKWSSADNRRAVAEEVATRRRWAENNIPNWDSLPSSSQKALLAYKYNYDFTKENSPKLFKALSDSNLYEVAKQMDATSKDPKFKKGLADRRKREQNWFLSDVDMPKMAAIDTPSIVEPAVNTAVFNPYINQVTYAPRPLVMVPDEGSYVKAHQMTPSEERAIKLQEKFDAIDHFNKLMGLIGIQNNPLQQFVPKTGNSTLDALSMLQNNNGYGGPIVDSAVNEYRNGGGIHIKKSHQGRLTELKKRTGKTEAELYNDGNPAHKKMVVFARSARKWKHGLGGNLYDGTTENSQQMITTHKPYYDRDGVLLYNRTLPEIVIIPDSQLSPAERNYRERQRQGNLPDYAEHKDRELTARQVAAAQKEWENSFEKQALDYGQAIASGIGMGADMISRLPIYSSLKGASTLSRAETPLDYVESGLWLAPIVSTVGKTAYDVAKPVVSKSANEVTTAWTLRNPEVPEGYIVTKPQVRTRFGDVEIDNPNLLYHLDRGDGAGAFSNQGAYVEDGMLLPGVAKEGENSYSWWNLGRPYATSVNGQPMTRLMTTTKDTPGMLHVRSQNYPIGQWNGKRGLVTNAEYVNPESVDVSNSVYRFMPDYGWRKVSPKAPTLTWGKGRTIMQYNDTGSLYQDLGTFTWNRIGKAGDSSINVKSKLFGDFIGEGSEQSVYNSTKIPEEVLKAYTDRGFSTVDGIRDFHRKSNWMKRNQVPFQERISIRGFLRNPESNTIYPVYSQGKMSPFVSPLQDRLSSAQKTQWENTIIPQIDRKFHSKGYAGSAQDGIFTGPLTVGDISPWNIGFNKEGQLRFIDFDVQ